LHSKIWKLGCRENLNFYGNSSITHQWMVFRTRCLVSQCVDAISCHLHFCAFVSVSTFSIMLCTILPQCTCVIKVCQNVAMLDQELISYHYSSSSSSSSIIFFIFLLFVWVVWQYQCKWLPGKTRPRNVKQYVKLNSLTYCQMMLQLLYHICALLWQSRCDATRCCSRLLSFDATISLFYNVVHVLIGRDNNFLQQIFLNSASQFAKFCGSPVTTQIFDM